MSSAPAAPFLSTRRGLLTLILLCGAQFLVVLDQTIVNTALPSIERALHFSVHDLQWVLSGYIITFGGFLLLGGRAADLLGRRRIFTAGLVVFSLASLAGGLASPCGRHRGTAAATSGSDDLNTRALRHRRRGARYGWADASGLRARQGS
jgi:MFS family permease